MKKPWTPTDIALVGASALATSVIIFVFWVLAGLSVDFGAWDLAFLIPSWVTGSIGLLALVVAAIAKVIGIGVRSASD